MVSNERPTTRACNPTIGQGRRREAMSASWKVFRDRQQRHQASLRHCARDALDPAASSGIQNARCRVEVPRHRRDAEAVERDPVGADDQAMGKLTQAILPAIGDPFMRARSAAAFPKPPALRAAASRRCRTILLSR